MRITPRIFRSIGVGAGKLVDVLTPFPASINPNVVIGGVVGSVLLGAIFGIWPAGDFRIAPPEASMLTYTLIGLAIGTGLVALLVAVRHPELVGRLVIISTPIKRSAFYPDILAQQGQVGAAAAEAMKQTPMYQLYASIAPRPEDFPRLLGKVGDMMKGDFDYSKEIAGIKATTMIVAGDSDMFPPSHAAEFFGLLGGGKRDGGWDGSGRPNARLAILPGMTHYAMGSAPAVVSP